MRSLLVALLTLAFMACGKNKSSNLGSGELYPKMDITQLQPCDASNPCASPGDSCTYYVDGAYCYADGREGEVVGCTSGSLVLGQSYPARAGCY